MAISYAPLPILIRKHVIKRSGPYGKESGRHYNGECNTGWTTENSLIKKRHEDDRRVTAEVTQYHFVRGRAIYSLFTSVSLSPNRCDLIALDVVFLVSSVGSYCNI